MSAFIYKVLSFLRFEARASPAHSSCFTQVYPFSSSAKSIPESHNQLSFTLNYLINTCGFAPERAISASKYVKLEGPVKPDSVLAFLKNHGLTKTQIRSCIRTDPRVLSCSPEKALLPKVKFLESKGISRTDIAKILSTAPSIFQRSLENQIIPAFSFLTSFLQSKEMVTAAIRRFGGLLRSDIQTCVQPNIEILRHAGVPDENIIFLMRYQPTAFMTSNDRFGQAVEEVKKMGFDPVRTQFVVALHALRAMSKATWEKKVEIYKKWGWSDDEIRLAFKKHPWCMTRSEDKITRVMNFFVNKMGYESSIISKRPHLISLSFEKRIVPRCAVYQVLISKGFITAHIMRLINLLMIPERSFLDRVVKLHKEEASELLKLYNEKLGLVK